MSEALEKAAEAMWLSYADEPLQVGKFKEPTDYRGYRDLGEPAKQGLRHYARAAITAFLSEVGLEGIRAAILSEPTINAGLQAHEVYKALMAHVADKGAQND